MRANRRCASAVSAGPHPSRCHADRPVATATEGRNQYPGIGSTGLRPSSEAYPALLGLPSPYQSAVRRYHEEQEAEKQRVHRARQFAEAEAHEEQLKQRLRSGERPETVEEERRRFRERQERDRLTPVLLP